MAKKIMGYGHFFCWNCGQRIEKNAENCFQCGAKYSGKNKYGNEMALGAGGIGWSGQSEHPCFKRYVKNYRRYAYIWLIALSLLVPTGLLFSGQLALDQEGLMVIGGVVGVFWLFGLVFLSLQYGKNKADWDGIVEDKKVIQETRTVKDDDGNRRKETYTKFVVGIRKQDGSLYEIKKDSPATEYEYYRVGDYVHYHGKKYLNYIEKYDKSLDQIIPCVSCRTQCDSRNNFCERCGSIILKGVPTQREG